MWRFRKMFNFGAFRTSVSKSGVGYSYGLLGFRFGVSPNGNRYISFGISGTGLYFIKYFKSPQFLKNKSFDSTITNTASSVMTSTSKQNKINEWWKQKN